MSDFMGLLMALGYVLGAFGLWCLLANLGGDS